MRIEWVNHASFIVDSGSIRLICDPWLEGTAFNNGWSLLSPTKLRYQDFASITHIWFSHEHPDHFSPPNLKKIPEEFRRRITVLFHHTNDKRVVGVCRSLNFIVLELPNREPVDIAQHFRITCGQNGRLDSWMAISADGKMLLNLNDCVLPRRQDLLSIKRTTGEVDVLLSQFSYANWVGNPDDHESHERHAQRKRSEMSNQIRTFEPRQFIPFASFVYFCHAENFFMNESVNRITDVCRFTTNNLHTETLALYPADQWEVGTARNCSEAFRRYEEDFGRALDTTPLTSPSIDIEKLKETAENLVKRCVNANNRLLIRAMPAPVVRISDLNDRTFELSFRHGLREMQNGAPDIALSSESLLYCMKNSWGGETLEINGRFQVPQGARPRRFFQFFRVPQYNSYGNPVNLKFLGNRIIDKTRNALAI